MNIQLETTKAKVSSMTDEKYNPTLIIDAEITEKCFVDIVVQIASQLGTNYVIDLIKENI